MKLKINGFENEIIFDANNINVLVIEDSKLFVNIIDMINDKIKKIDNDEVFLVDENNNEMDMDKKAFILLDLFNIEYNTKKILDKIYDIISENISKNQDYEMEKITLRLRDYLINEINELPFEFIIKDEIKVNDILKLYSLKIDSENYITILEKVELVIEMLSILKVADLLIIPNLKLYLSDEELVELYKYSMYNNIKLLVIERNQCEKLDYEEVLVIDKFFNEN